MKKSVCGNDNVCSHTLLYIWKRILVCMFLETNEWSLYYKKINIGSDNIDWNKKRAYIIGGECVAFADMKCIQRWIWSTAYIQHCEMWID